MIAKTTVLLTYIAAVAVAIYLSFYPPLKENYQHQSRQIESSVIELVDTLSTEWLSNHQQHQQAFKNILSTALVKEQLMLAISSQNDARIETVLSQLMTLHPDIFHVSWINPEGIIRFSTDKGMIGRIVAGESYFIHAKQKGSYLQTEDRQVSYLQRFVGSGYAGTLWVGADIKPSVTDVIIKNDLNLYLFDADHQLFKFDKSERNGKPVVKDTDEYKLMQLISEQTGWYQYDSQKYWVHAVPELSLRVIAQTEQSTFKTFLAYYQQRYLALASGIAVAGLLIILLVLTLFRKGKKTSSQQQLPMALFWINQSGKIERANEQAERLFSVSSKRLQKRSVETLFPERFKEEIQMVVNDCFDSREPLKLQTEKMLYAVDNGGKEFSVDAVMSALPVKGGYGILLSVVEQAETSVDVLDLQKYADELSRSNEALEQFAYAASHDLKAPLRAINNLAQWISDDAKEQLPSKSKQHLQQMQTRVNRMSKMLDDVLTYSKASKADDVLEEVDIALMIEEMVDSLQSEVKIHLSFVTETPSITTLKTPLAQIFQNLINNAVKHHHKSQIQLDIAIEEQPEFYQFSVKDDGPGIPEQYHDKIFELFSSSKPKQSSDSTGMGLAIVKRTLQTYGADIRVVSEENNGTEFIFTWPKNILNQQAQHENVSAVN